MGWESVMMVVMVCGVCLRYEYEFLERERGEREREGIVLLVDIGRVENGLEGDPKREGWLVFLSLTQFLSFCDTFYFTHKVIIYIMYVEQILFCFHFT